jgi:nitronate monooxygenase
MWPNNALTERLNLKWPILQAPMGSASTPGLAAAVTNAGGLGGLGMWARTAEQAARRIAGFRQQSGGSLNVNYPIWPDPRSTPEATEAMRAHLQSHYDALGQGAVPEPQAEISDVGSDHVALLLDTKPEVVSFHFGLPEPEVIRALKAAGPSSSRARRPSPRRARSRPPAATPSSPKVPNPAATAPPLPASISACSPASSHCCRRSSTP